MSDNKPLSGIKAPDNRQRYHGSPSSPNREENGEHHDDGGCTFVVSVIHFFHFGILHLLTLFFFTLLIAC